MRGPEGQDYLRTKQVSVAGRECSLNWTSSRGWLNLQAAAHFRIALS